MTTRQLGDSFVCGLRDGALFITKMNTQKLCDTLIQKGKLNCEVIKDDTKEEADMIEKLGANISEASRRVAKGAIIASMSNPNATVGYKSPRDVVDHLRCVKSDLE